MLTAANLNFIAFWRFAPQPQRPTGVMFAIFSIAVAAAEAAVGLALVIAVYRHRRTTHVDQLDAAQRMTPWIVSHLWLFPPLPLAAAGADRRSSRGSRRGPAAGLAIGSDRSSHSFSQWPHFSRRCTRRLGASVHNFTWFTFGEQCAAARAGSSIPSRPRCW